MLVLGDFPGSAQVISQPGEGLVCRGPGLGVNVYLGLPGGVYMHVQCVPV